MTIHEMLDEAEKSTLEPYAMLACNTQGRLAYTTPCTLRTEFQRDRDRITHSKSFRRLMHKTQVFLSPEEDHYRTRLTHTLEVTQIARTIARSLRLNEDLCEAIGLGHDLGHTPFGHAGERVLQRCYSGEFTHNSQSLRVVDKLESLNLTYEVRDGILNHVWGTEPCTLEGKIIQYADRIAYINHDIDDACRAGVLSADMIPGDLCRILGDTHSTRINTMVTSVITASRGKPQVVMEDEVLDATLRLRRFLFENVYRNPVAKGEEGKAEKLLELLFVHFCENPLSMPTEYRKNIEEDGVERSVCDYISGMTDRYAISVFNELFVPQAWTGKVTSGK